MLAVDFKNKLTIEEGLQIVKSKANIEVDFSPRFSSIKSSGGKDYYIYALNGTDYTIENYAYCVDENSGELYKCSNSFELIPIQ